MLVRELMLIGIDSSSYNRNLLLAPISAWIPPNPSNLVLNKINIIECNV